MNSRLRNIILIAAAVAVGSLGVAAVISAVSGITKPAEAGQAGVVAIDEERSYGITGTESIELSSVSEDIEFIETDGSEIRIRLHGTMRTGRSENAPTLEERSTGRKIEVRVRHPLRTIGFYSSDLRMDVYLPAGYSGSLKAVSVSGEIMLGFGDYAELETRTTSGDVTLEEVAAGRLSLHSVSGAIRASAASGVTEAGTTSGDIRIEGETGETGVRTVSGSVDLTLKRLERSLDINTTSGDVRIALQEESAFELSARSTSGDIDCSFPITLSGSSSKPGNNTLNGSVGSGGPPVNIKTVSGDIEIGK